MQERLGYIRPSNASHDAMADLVAKMRQFARHSRARGTLQSYRARWRQFAGWCQARGRISCPASAETVTLFLADIAGRYRYTTIKTFVYAIAFVHRIGGEPFDKAGFAAVLKGIRQTHGNASRQVAPITIAELRAMVAALPESFGGLRDRALLTVGFAGALRCSELVALDLGAPMPPGTGFIDIGGDGARIILLRSKTDQAGRGIAKLLPRGGNPCPVEALERWLTVARITSGPVFRSISKWSTPLAERLHCRAVGKIVKRATYASALQGGLGEAQASVRAFQVSSHSLRAGFVTSAALANVSSEDIAAHVGWVNTRMAYRYIRRIDPMIHNPAQQVLSS